MQQSESIGPESINKILKQLRITKEGVRFIETLDHWRLGHKDNPTSKKIIPMMAMVEKVNDVFIQNITTTMHHYPTMVRIYYVTE